MDKTKSKLLDDSNAIAPLAHKSAGITSMRIRKHIHQLSDSDIFVSRDFLGYGTRNAVDLCLSRMVNNGIILRLARGVFVKVVDAFNQELPSVYKVAEAKCRAFGKMLFMHGKDFAHWFGLVPEGNVERTFITNGCGTSFRYRNIRICFKNAAPRKVNLTKSKDGSLISAFWHFGKALTTPQLLHAATINLRRVERSELYQSIPLMPGWLAKFFDRVPSHLRAPMRPSL